MKRALFGIALLATTAWAFLLTQPPDTPTTDPPLGGDAMVAVQVPTSVSEQEQMGQRAFDTACASCHGTNAQGRQDIAPPLVHKIYEPSHRGDASFLLAAQNGVRAHHWRFGDMPPVEGVTEAEVIDIVAYIRALQRENGIN
ncbi:cytochrome c [Seohaeicola saemankumensis]|uniref:c-type cytochrome n=1 Tax=Seohaeicola saemankumensis TaxID=481181 RepID=UPI001E3A7FDC|nr:cytochrome c [Seohaeicola saemankumensis]MCD1625330.1 cytochrome c [Seohaeicola saemankumensis]